MESSSQIVTTNKPTPSFLQAGCSSCCPAVSMHSHSLSIHFKGHFPGEPGLALVLLKLRMVEVVVTTGDMSCKAPVKSSQPANQNLMLYTLDALPLLNHQCQSTEEK